MRVLFVVPPLAGHVNPTVSLGAALVARGHDVAWAGHDGVLQRLLPEGSTAFDVGTHLDEDALAALAARGRLLRGAAAFKFLWEDLFWPLGRAMIAPVDAAAEAFRADVIVADQQALAGGIVARRRGLPWVTSAATSATLVDPLDALPQLHAWKEEGEAALQREAGLAPMPGGLISPHALLAYTTPALAGADRDWPGHWHFVGPAITPRPSTPFPWADLADDRPTVLVSLGTVSVDRGRRFFEAAVEALTTLGVQGVFVAPPEQLSDVPAPHVVQRFVPQLELLPHCDAVVCHAGHNTVVEALWHGLPLVVAPIRDDQPVVAQQVVDAGAGVRVKFGRAKAEKLREAVEAALGPALRDGARAVRESFRSAGGADQAAAVVEASAPDGPFAT